MTSRNVFKYVFNNFLNSLRPRRPPAILVGEDYFGNKYYEKPPNPALGKLKPERYYVPPVQHAETPIDSELTAEWDSWLRGRRIDPPTNEELRKNLTIMQMKKNNAMKLEEEYGKSTQKVTGLGSYPEHGNKFLVDPLNKDNRNK